MIHTIVAYASFTLHPSSIFLLFNHLHSLALLYRLPLFYSLPTLFLYLDLLHLVRLNSTIQRRFQRLVAYRNIGYIWTHCVLQTFVQAVERCLSVIVTTFGTIQTLGIGHTAVSLSGAWYACAVLRQFQG